MGLRLVAVVASQGEPHRVCSHGWPGWVTRQKLEGEPHRVCSHGWPGWVTRQKLEGVSTRQLIVNGYHYAPTLSELHCSYFKNSEMHRSQALTLHCFHDLIL